MRASSVPVGPDVVILSGPCGAGKSSVAFECMNLLEAAGVAAAMVDGELAYFHPKPKGDRFGYAVAQASLAALIPVYAAQGIARLLLARVVEDEEQFAIVTRAVPHARVRLLRLVASEATVLARLRRREIGSGLEWHVKRSAEISKATMGDPVDAEREIGEIARDVLARVGWLPAGG